MERPSITDSELIRRFKDGDAAALEELVARYEDKVYSLVYRMLGNPQDAEDALQDTFLNVMRSLARFEERSSFSTWLYRIAANAALTRLRKRGRQEKSEAEFLEDVYSVQKQARSSVPMNDWSGEPDEELLSGERAQILREAIEELPEPYRVVFVLRDVERMPAQDVAEVLQLSVPAVKSRLHRARMFLRNRLSGYLTEGR